MARPHTYTDNDHVASKVALRVETVLRLGEPRPILVLDAYHGHGRLWKLVADALPEGWTVRMYRSDKESRKAGTLKINNERLLEVIDLHRFDLIDLDAYGWPTEQLRTVATRAPEKLVVVTRISRLFGRIPNIILHDLEMNVPPGSPRTLLTHVADELWEAWLYHLGYRTSRLVRFDNGTMVKRYEAIAPDGWPVPPET